MINLNELTQEQRWGVDFATMQANKPILQENENIVRYNENLPVEAHRPLNELYTSESYLEKVIKSACDSYYKQLIDYKKKMAMDMFDNLTPEQQGQIVEQLGIPNVLN